MAKLTFVSRTIAFEDLVSTNNPQRRAFDWTRQMSDVYVNNPQSFSYIIPSYSTQAVFNGIVSLAADGTTEFSLSTVVGHPGTYRLSWTGIGTDPAFRTARSLSLAGGNLILTPKPDYSVEITHTAGAVFGTVNEGDVGYIPGVSTGDSGPFDPLNEGEWVVIYATSTSITVVRPPNLSHSAKYESVPLTTNAQFQVFSNSGIQKEQSLELKSTFPSSVRKTYEINKVTAGILEFYSGTILPSISSIVPGSGAFTVYSNSKIYVGIDTDQDIGVFINGSNTDVRVEPFIAGDPTKIGTFEVSGTVFSLTIVNKSSQAANVKVRSAE